MGVLGRFKDIMESNINALLDKAEDPSKMIDQYLRNLNSDLGNVKAETAAIMAEEQRTKRAVDECNFEIEKMQGYAKKAVQAGNDDDARKFLEKKAELVQKQGTLKIGYDAARANAKRMREMHDKLVKDIGELNSRKDAIKAKLSVAKTQEKINKMGSSCKSAGASISAFDRMEEKANKIFDEANAMAELNKSQEENDFEALANKYDSAGSSVEAELTALKQGDVDAELEALKLSSVDVELEALKQNKDI